MKAYRISVIKPRCLASGRWTDVRIEIQKSRGVEESSKLSLSTKGNMGAPCCTPFSMGEGLSHERFRCLFIYKKM